MSRRQQPDPESTHPPTTKGLSDLPVVRATPATNDDWDLEQDLEDEPELAAYYRGLAEMNEAIVEAHRTLTAPDTDEQ
jgi:hypothetical protein